METTTEALILKKVPYSGSSVIASGYTRRYGTMSFMVRGVGRKKGNKLSALEPLSIVDITLNFREKYTVQTAKEISIKPSSGGLYYNPVKGSIQLFLAEILYKSLREESPDEGLFDYIVSSLEYFETSNDHTYFHLIFLVRLTKFFGFFPQGEFDKGSCFFDLQNGAFTSNRNSSLHTLDAEDSKALSILIGSEYTNKLQFNSDLRRRLLQALVDYYRLHLEGFGAVKSLPVLMEVFSA